MHKPIIGQIVLEITCADSSGLLNRINSEKIRIRNVLHKGDLDICITAYGQDYPLLQALVEKHGGTIRIRRFSRVHKLCRNLKKHPAALIILLILLLLTVYLPKRVLFVSVEGNISVPTNRILEAAETCGLQFGASRRAIRSESIKNTLLQQIPQLQWAGVNTNGCTATISVREKTTPQLSEETEREVCSIVAKRDGIIQNCTVYQGNPLCTTGQAVKAGQTLVSGYLDCGTIIKATRADAEISALTFRKLTIVAPSASITRGQQSGQKNIFSLRIGKKLIKLSKDSGNSDASCAKIYLEEYVRLPGNFCLPVSLIKETIIYYEEAEQIPILSDAEQWLKDYSVAYLKSTMIAGNILSAQSNLSAGDGYSCLRGSFTCIEMIGQVQYEQKLFKGDIND